VVLKIDSPDIIYKSDVGGVELNISNEATLRAAFRGILERAHQAMPEARIDGISVQPMRKRRFAREVMVGVTHDSSFGPVITFGAGGIAVEVMHDRALSLPPLNKYLVGSMIRKTRIGQLLGAFKNLPAGQYEMVVEAAREGGGREVLRLPFSWPAKSAQQSKVQGEHELGALQLSIKP